MTTTTSTSRRSSSRARGRANGPSHIIARPGGGHVNVRCSTVADGDFHRTLVPFVELEARRRALVDLPWTMLEHDHGVDVRHVRQPGEHDGSPGDVAVTDLEDAVLGCWVGDCAPVVLVGDRQAIATVHAGWRGLAAGVLDIASSALGDQPSAVVVGPTIGPCCYEFGDDDLAAVAGGLGVDVGAIAARTSWGTVALDVTAAIAAVATRWSVPLVRLGGCTGCSYPGFSHRVRHDAERHVVAVWAEAT
jgi:hypothetical protein